MKKIFSKEVLIGIFTVAVLAGAYFGFNFIKNTRLFSDDNVIYAVFQQADGLEVSAPVIIKGFKIGQVEKISFNIKTSQVVVKMIVNGEYPLPANSEAKIASTSLLGGKVLDIKLGNDDTRSLASGDTMRTAQERSIIDAAGEEYGKLKEMASEIVSKLTKALDGINAALSPENTAALSATMSNLKSISGNIDEVVGGQKDNLNKTLTNLAALSASLREMSPDLQRGVKNIALLSDSLALQGPVLVRNAAQSLDNLNAILTKLKDGQGSAGKLLTDEQLYANVNDAVANLSLLLADFKENPKRYINVSVFGGGNKEKREKPKK